MSSLIIQGSKNLKGEINIQGSKNAATPIIAATILFGGNFILQNIPEIEDVKTMLKILELLGAKIKTDFQNHKTQINTQNITSHEAEFVEIKRLRSSILLLGPLLARFGRAKLLTPGGCVIGNRPLDSHMKVLKAFGAEIKYFNTTLATPMQFPKQQDYLEVVLKKSLKSAKIILPEFSVTATENALMLASLAKGKTIIKMAATEPHVQDLGNFLIQAGARIKGLGTHTIEIEGVKNLNPIEYKIIPDQIEAGTWLVLGALLGNPLIIKNAPMDHLDIVLEKLKEMGVEFTTIVPEKTVNKLSLQNTFATRTDTVQIFASKNIKPFKLQTMPYPGFPTDLQAPFSILATQAHGMSLIHDPMYEGRFNHLQELNKMGAKTILSDPHRAIIYGKTPLNGAHIKSFDLRAGATLILAGLIAKGKTIIDEAEQIDRGYEKIEEKLKKIGADIKRIKN